MPAPPVTPILPPNVRRFFGIDNDTNSNLGGTDYDTLVNGGASPSADIPDVTIPWPVTTATPAWNQTRVTRDAEVRGHRAGRAPIPIGAVPSINFTVPAYRAIAEKLLKLVMGKEDPVTGSAAPYTHTLKVLDYVDGAPLPAVLLQVVEDLLHFKACGVVVGSINWTMPIAAESTIEVTTHAKYMRQESPSASYPSPDNATLGDAVDPLMLRDVKVYFDDGTQTSLPIVSLTFGINNNLDVSAEKVFAAGHNIEAKSIGAGVRARNRKLQFPTFFRLSGGHTVTLGITLANADDQQQLAEQWGQIQKIVAEVNGNPIPTTAANELIRLTAYSSQWETAGGDALASRGDIGMNLSGNAYYSQGDGRDILIESVNDIATLL